MSASAPQPIFRKDYQRPLYNIETTELYFDLQETKTLVTATLTIHPTAAAKGAPLSLAGEALSLQEVVLNGTTLGAEAYTVDDTQLIIKQVPSAPFILTLRTEIKPQENTTLMGLYKSSDIFCTQCEAMGFRRMTYYIDRPDVMSIFTTTIEADQQKYPILLSNGNLIAKQDHDNGRHTVTWHDPFKKPSYLFALVAGNLACLEDEFITKSGKRVALQIYVEPENLDKCKHAMLSLQKAMRWDETVFGLEYDLEVYMIVAVHDFNQGAMENKGLNIFNDKYVLAKPETATDTDYQQIEAVIGHEYFHNWTGNRVTVRDWFQLSLKEGLTVFRDSEFSADMNSRVVKRIQDITVLRSQQFPEDQGPMAHPVRPESYIEMNNFYTVTVYEKGAEVIRMLRTMLGAERFRKGMDIYIGKNDGQAVTTDDFVDAMQAASGIDLTQFKLWYSTAGTPKITVKTDYNPTAQTYTVTLTQAIAPTPGQAQKPALHIPFAVGLLDSQGEDMPLRLADQTTPRTTEILHLREPTQSFTFTGIKAKPVLSVLRDFSAPVICETNRSTEELIFLLAHDTDGFARWDAGQQLLKQTLLELITAHQQKKALQVDPAIIAAFKNILHDAKLDPALKAEFLRLPSEKYMSEWQVCVDVEATHAAFCEFRRVLALQLEGDFWQMYEACQIPGPYTIAAADMAKRSLKNRCLSYLVATGSEAGRKQAFTQFTAGHNMTDVLAALSLLANIDCEERSMALQKFYQKWQQDPLVIDKWFSIQALSELQGTATVVGNLISHPAFEIKNPNRVYALLRNFGAQNSYHFHDASGLGYRLIADHIMILDEINPMVAARVASSFLPWRRYDAVRQQLMKAELERIAAKTPLSRDVYEIVSKTLAGG